MSHDGEHSIDPFLSAPRSSLKSRTDHERPQTPDSHTHLFSTSCCAPHRRRVLNPPAESVATHDCTRDTVRGGAIASGVAHALIGDGCSPRTVGPRRAGRRCRTPCGTASLDAVPQRRGCRSPLPSAGQRRLSRRSSDTPPCCESRSVPLQDSGVSNPRPPLPFRYGYKFWTLP